MINELKTREISNVGCIRAIPALLMLHKVVQFWATIKHLDGQSNKFKAYDDVGVQLYITT